MRFDFNQPYGYLRILLALPQMISYDCYLDDVLYAKDLLFEDFTIYKPIAAGEHMLSLCYHKETTELLNQSFRIAPGRIYTLIIAYEPYSETPQYYLLNDPPKKIPEACLLLRVAPFCQLEAPFYVQLIDTNPVFKKLKLGQPSPYLAFPPASYTLELIHLETQKVLLKKENCQIKPTRYYTLYLLGGTKDFPLRFVLTIDGNSFISFPQIA